MIHNLKINDNNNIIMIIQMISIIVLIQIDIFAVIEESIIKHDEARINPNDISVDDIPIDSDTSLSLSVGLNEMPITTDTQPKDKENCGQIDAPNQNITDENPQNANTTNPVDGKNQRQNTNDGSPKQNNTNPVTVIVNSFAQTDSIENPCNNNPNSDIIWIKLQYVSSIYKESVHTV